MDELPQGPSKYVLVGWLLPRPLGGQPAASSCGCVVGNGEYSSMYAWARGMGGLSEVCCGVVPWKTHWARSGLRPGAGYLVSRIVYRVCSVISGVSMVNASGSSVGSKMWLWHAFPLIQLGQAAVESRNDTMWHEGSSLRHN
jgi:hypothetical protein